MSQAQKQSGVDFRQVFDPATTTADCAALSPVPATKRQDFRFVRQRSLRLLSVKTLAIMGMIRQGWPYGRIAQRHGVSRNYVYALARKMGEGYWREPG